ncbi:MAG TPA: hypothetical protein P5079_02675, partial [Elusimicrobiota bacterium]|nr:hypothetical protein [Elusimicrobiota bacterium]
MNDDFRAYIKFLGNAALKAGLAIIILFACVGIYNRSSLFLQERRNLKGLSAEGGYKILCFGDSTTQAQWPPILEEELNRRGGNIRFKVIDRGRVFNRISRVLYFLEGDLDKYQPDMVVVMMGMLEGRWGTKETGWGGWLADRFDSFWAGVRLLVGRWGEGERRNGERKLIKVFEWLERRPKEEAPPKEAASLKADDYIRWGKRYRGEGRFDKAEKMFKQGIAASPGDASGYVLLGRLYQAKDDDEKAEELYRAGIRAVN